MRRKLRGMKRTFLILLLVILLAGCAPKTAEPAGELAFYLTAEPISGGDILLADLDELALAEEPLIAADEILSYSVETHDLEVAPAVIERLNALTVPVSGLGFVAVLGDEPLFAGAVWTPISSLSYEGVTIWTMLNEGGVVHLYSGYPGMDEPMGDDPREDERMLAALRQAGKLK